MRWSVSRRQFTKSLYTIWMSVGWYLVVAVVIFLGYSFLHPKFSATWNQRQRAKLLSEYLTQIQTEQEVDPQLFWEFRERFSPGVFVVNHDFIDIGETQMITSIASPSAQLLSYQSPYLNSSENIVQRVFVDRPGRFLDKERLAGKSIIWFDERHHVYFKSDDTLAIEFVKPISEMRLANGLFDYKEEEQQILQKGYWWHQTLLSVPDGVEPTDF